MVTSAVRFLAMAKRAASVCAIALATSGTINRAAVVEAPPALPVAMVQAPRRSSIVGIQASAAQVALSEQPPTR